MEPCEKRERHYKLNAERRARLKAEGLCQCCGGPGRDGKSLCGVCAAKRAVTKSAKEKANKKDGFCRCGKTAVPNRTRCEECAAYMSAAQKKRHTKHKDKALCVKCGKEAPEKGLAKCKSCLEAYRVWLRDRLEARKSQGLCHTCGAVDPIGNYCESCRYNSVAQSHFRSKVYADELRAKMEAQGNRCALLGIPIAIGVNAELDHIVPKAKGGTKTLDNVQWVSELGNLMKLDSTEEEFFSMLTEALPVIIEHVKRKTLGSL